MNPEKWWTTGEMAEICLLSESQFRILFRRKTGMKPKEYIDRIKIQQAIKMLTTTTLPVRRIAKSIGYLDPYHFSRRFKHLVGISPDGYRKQYAFTDYGI
jgi:AraC-like DNA-binding protein